MITFSEPRTEAVIEDWPHGTKRVTALFKVETNKKGSRVSRVTTGKPKATTYHKRMLIVTGDDGKIYGIGDTEYGGQAVVWHGTLKTEGYYYEDDPQHTHIMALLDAADKDTV